MPESQEEAEKYVTELKHQYELGIKCLDLVIDIEAISKIEYEPEYTYETSIYAKKTSIEDELFTKYILDNNIINLQMSDKVISSKLKEFMDSLSIEEKRQLLIETFTLSYNRNVFNYFNGLRIILEATYKQNNQSSEFAYNVYKKFLINMEVLIILEMPLQKVYDELKIVYDTEFFKQRVKKK